MKVEKMERNLAECKIFEQKMKKIREKRGFRETFGKFWGFLRKDFFDIVKI
jgi:hypothetical protein